jgi:hypothetical protein
MRLSGRQIAGWIVLGSIPILALAAFLFHDPRWVEAGPTPDCVVRKLWRNAGAMTVTWSGPCIDGRADGRGTLQWTDRSRIVFRYDGEMQGGRVTGRGGGALWGIRFDGTWQDGRLILGSAVYEDGRRFDGKWYKSGWNKGVLIKGPRRYEGGWYEGRLTGKGVASGPEGRYEGRFSRGKPEGSGVFVAANGERYEGEWANGRPTKGNGRVADADSLTCLWWPAAQSHSDRWTSARPPAECGAD